MYCAVVPLMLAIRPSITPPPSSLVSAVLSMLEAAVTTVSAGRSSCAPHTIAALKANPDANTPSRLTPRAFTVELPFTDPACRQCGIRYQLMLSTNRSHYAVLKPGYLGKSYQLASVATRVAEKPLTCGETHCERRMSR